MRSPHTGTLERNAPNVWAPSDAEKPSQENSNPPRTTRDAFWTVKELARYLRISERWIHERTRHDEIPCHRLGTALRFDPQEIQVWMIQRRESLAGRRGVA